MISPMASIDSDLDPRPDSPDSADNDASESQFSSLMSEFDDFVASEKSGQMATSRALQYGFDAGDLVWGKVKSHPWWPGHVFNDAFATPQVRRTRREGHVLLAFFGDSSYGWFDPAEFIPFDANFPEKSTQTSSRNFARAVDEAVDEVCRRRSLGLLCRCRNPDCFRPGAVPGYFVVDVPDFEPNAVYSAKQIQKARDSFDSRESLDFVKGLAVAPSISWGEEKDLELAKNRATMVAYRKAVFEEFDVTYAQAFGVQSGRVARDLADSKDLAKQPPRAPLSGPMVIAETLGGGKSVTKEKKVKDGSKKDKLKRRDESGNVKKTKQVNQGKVSSKAPLASAEGSVAVGDGDSMTQKRDPAMSLKSEVVSTTGTDSSLNESEAIITGQASASSSLATEDVSVETKPSLDKGKGAVKEVKEESGPVSDSIPVSKGTSVGGTSQSLKSEGLDSTDQQPQSVSTVGVGEDQDGHRGEGPSPTPTELKRSSVQNKVGGVKKTKVKRPREEPDTENLMIEGKKKKKKKPLETEQGLDPQKPSVLKKKGLSAVKKVGKAGKSILAPKVSKRVVVSSDDLSDFSLDGVGNAQLEFPRLLSDLQFLAQTHGMERSNTAIVRKFFLRFRSLVFQKSLGSPPPESESTEACPTKPSANIGTIENSSTEPVRDLPSPKTVKPSFRSEDPTISGRKRAPSDRQEEITAKRSKKVSDIRMLASEKKANQKTSESYRSGEGRESAVPLGRKARLDPSKRSEPLSLAAEPTMLVMKFPPKTSLPSPAELKARFARFGPMDQSAQRIFWKSSMCRVVFRHKFDAQAACKYAASNSSLFGTPGMRCYVKEVGVAGPDGQDDTTTTITTTNNTQQAKDSSIVLQRQSSAMMQQPASAAAQLKSCLKKAPADDPGLLGPGPSSGNARGTPRVKFVLAGEESGGSSSNRVEPSLGGNRNNNNSASFGDGGVGVGIGIGIGGGALVPSTTTSVAMDISVRNIQKVVPLSPLPILPPPQFSTNLHQQHHHPHHNHPDAMMTMMGPRNTHNNSDTSNISAPPITNSVDISQQLLSLLTRCNDVVTNVTGLLGYVPFHPL